VCVMKLLAMNSRPLHVTFRHPITVMNKIRKRKKEQKIAAELGNRTLHLQIERFTFFLFHSKTHKK